jgi:hypothetical protein
VLAGFFMGGLVGAMAGLYPAWIAWRMPASAALSGLQGQETRRGMWLRRALTVLQLAAAMGLGGVTLAIALQTGYAVRTGPGFDPQPLLVLDLPGPARDGAGAANRSQRAFRDAVLRLPSVQSVAASDEAIGRPALHYLNVRAGAAAATQLVSKQVSRDWFATYGLAALAGRLYDAKRDPESGSGGIVINASAARQLGYPSARFAIGQRLTVDGGATVMEVIGVAPDLRHQSLREPSQPVIYMLGLSTPVLTVRVDGDSADAQQRIAALYRQYFPDDTLQMRRAAGIYALNYAEDRQLLSLLLSGTAVAGSIAACGIYVLAAFNVQRRTREIALRKLYGARGAAVARLLGYEFVVLVLLAGGVGLPCAAVVNARYLAGFADPVAVGPWALSAAFALALLVAAAATLRHGLAAMRIKPALALAN